MSAPAAAAPTGGSVLLAKLMAAVRPEFRVELLSPAPGVLTFDQVSCRIADCDQRPVGRQMCRAHYARWLRSGRPDIETFVAEPGPGVTGRSSLSACAAPGCRFGAARRGLCVSHHGRWERAGAPERATWLSGLPTALDDDHPVCRLSYCTLWTQGNSVMCQNHHSRWLAAGRPELEEFLRRCEFHGVDRFDFRPLAGAPQVRLELQYALQCRHDERQGNTSSSLVMPMIRLAAASQVGSLLDWPITRWAEYAADAATTNGHTAQNGQLAFLRYAREHLEDLVCGSGWDSEFDRDVWALRRLGIQGHPRPAQVRPHRPALAACPG